MLLEKIALLLTIIGGINWGLVGAFKFNLVDFLFSFAPVVASIIYVVVGLSACYVFYAYLLK